MSEPSTRTPKQSAHAQLLEELAVESGCAWLHSSDPAVRWLVLNHLPGGVQRLSVKTRWQLGCALYPEELLQLRGWMGAERWATCSALAVEHGTVTIEQLDAACPMARRQA